MKIHLFHKITGYVDTVSQGCIRAFIRLKEQAVEIGRSTSILQKTRQVLEFVSVLPGLVLIFCSLYTLFVPTEWLLSLLIFTFSCGVAGTVLAVQTVLLKRKTYQVLRDLKGGIMIQTGGGVSEEQLLNLIESSGAKVTLH
jgi:hypothetical protein